MSSLIVMRCVKPGCDKRENVGKRLKKLFTGASGHCHDDWAAQETVSDFFYILNYFPFLQIAANLMFRSRDIAMGLYLDAIPWKHFLAY